MPNEPVIYLRHVRAAGYCVSGMTRMLQRLGVDEVEFLKNGTPVSQVAHHDNPLLRKVKDIATAEWRATQHGKE